MAVKLLIWGTGLIARKLIENGINGEIVGFIETKRSTDFFRDKPIYDAEQIPDDYDYIIIANSYTSQIFEWCLNHRMNMERIIFLFWIKERIGLKDLDKIKDILGERNYTDYCAEFDLVYKTFFSTDKEMYQKKNRRLSFAIDEPHLWPIISDKYAYAGSISNYFWQDLWAARLIIKSGIKKHFDIGSRLDGFIAHLLAAEIDVTMIDIREFPGEIDHLHTIVDDATNLSQISDESVESISALCSLEHFGLGRYGDPVDPEACFKCFKNIQKKLKIGGNLYISVPVGSERVEFNAHRIFYASTILECFKSLSLEEFSCTAGGTLEYKPDISKYDNDEHSGEYRYGLFHFRK